MKHKGHINSSTFGMNSSRCWLLQMVVVPLLCFSPRLVLLLALQLKFLSNRDQPQFNFDLIKGSLFRHSPTQIQMFPYISVVKNSVMSWHGYARSTGSMTVTNSSHRRS